MKLELQRDLFERYPRFFRRQAGLPGAIDDEGICCGDGWFELVEAFAAEAEAWIDCRVRGGVPPRFWPRAVQVKEKFGSLRIAIRGDLPDQLAERRRRLCDELSTTVCEECGRAGQLRTESFWRTRCDACEAREGDSLGRYGPECFADWQREQAKLDALLAARREYR